MKYDSYEIAERSSGQMEHSVLNWSLTDTI